MSNSTPAGPAVAEPSRPSWRRKVPRVLLGALGLLVTGVVLLHSPPGRRLVSSALTRLASRTLGGEVRLERLDYRIWRGEASLTGVVLRRPGLELDCARADVSVGPFSGLRVAIDGPRVVVTARSRDDATPETGPSRPWSVLGALSSVALEHGRLELRDEAGSTWLSLDGVQIRLQREGQERRGRVRIAEAGLGWPGGGIRLTPVRSDVELTFDDEARTIRVASARVDAEGAVIEASGEVHQLAPLVAHADASGTVEASLLRRLFPGVDADGRVELQLSLASGEDGAGGTVALSTPGLTVASAGPWAGSLRGRLEGDRLVVDEVDLRGYGGRATASGALDLAGGRSELAVTTRGLEVAPLTGSLTGFAPPVASTADLDASLSVVNWQTKGLVGRGRVTLRPASGTGFSLGGEVDLRIEGERVAFDTDTLRVRGAAASLHGALAFDGDVDVRAALRLAETADVPALLADAGVAVPALALDGSLEARGELRGRLPEFEATARVATTGLAVEDIDLELAAALRATRSGIEIESLALQGADGRATASGFVPARSGREWGVNAELADLVLTDALARRGVPVPAVVQGGFAVVGTFDAPRATFVLDSRLGGDQAPPGSLHASGHFGRQGLTIERLSSEIGGGVVEASGAWAPAGAGLRGRLTAARVSLSDLPWRGESPLPEALRSVLSAEVTVSGQPTRPVGEAHFRLSSNTWREQPLPDLALEARSDGSTVDLEGRVGDKPLLTGQLALADEWPVRAEIDLATLPLDAFLAAATAGEGRPPSAALAGRATLELPLRAPNELRYDVGVEGLRLRVVREWQAGPFQVTGDVESFRVRGLTLTSGRSRLAVAGALGRGQPAEDALALTGEIPLEDVSHLIPGGQLAGQMKLDMRLRGELAHPDLEGSLTVADASGRVGGLAFQELELRGSARSGALELERARVRLAKGEVTAHGSLPFGPGLGAASTLEIDATGVDLGALLPSEPTASGLVAPLDLRARVRATALRLDAVQAEGEISRFSASVGAGALVLEAPVAWRWSDGRLSHDALRLRGERGELEIEGGVDLVSGAPPVRLRATGAADLALLNPFFGGALFASGPARIDVRASAGQGPLALEGEVRVDGGRLRLREPAMVVTDIAGRIEADGTSLRLVDFGGRVGSGRIGAAGRVVLDASGPDTALTLSVEEVPLAYPDGLRSRISGEIRLDGRAGRYRLGGDARVRRAIFARDLDGASRSLDVVGAELRALDARGSLLERVGLDLRVRLEDGLRVQNAQAQLIVDGAVTVGGDLVAPVIDGSLSIREGGEVRLSRAQLRITQGRVELRGFPSRSPILDIAGKTQVTGIRIDAQLTGPLEDLQTSLSSPNRPDLTQGDLATLILTGRTAQAAASESGAIVAEEVAAALGEALDRKLGGAVFVDVSRDESLIVEDTDPTQRFNVGVPLGPKLYVIYSQALDRGGRRWIVDLRPRGSLRVRLISDDDGSEALELANRTSFDLWSRGRRPAPVKETRPRVHTVEVSGVPQAEAAELLRHGGLEPGDEYDYFVGERAARRIAERLVDDGYRAAAVEAAESETLPGRVDVVLRVERGPLIRVQWSGDDPGKQGRRRAAGAWDPYQPVEDTAAQLARAVRRDLRAERYYQAAVEARVSRTGEDVAVAFEVARGPRGHGVDLAFEGLHTLRPEAVTAALPRVDDPAFFALLEPEAHSRLEARLRSTGARAGLLTLRAGPARAELDARGRLQVTIPVEEGPAATVVSLELPEEARSPGDGAPPRLRQREGEPFHLDAYMEDRVTLASWYRQQGYPEARVVGVLEPVDQDLVVRFAVEPGPRPRVGELRQGEGTRVRPSVVRKAVTLEPGDRIRPSELARSRERLSETRAFRSVDIGTEPDETGEVRDVVVDLVDRPDLEVEYSVRYTTAGSGEVGGAPSSAEAGQVQFGGAIEAVNPFGWAHRYRVYGLAGTKRTLLGASFDAASFFGRRWRTQVFVFNDQDNDTEIARLGEHIRGVAFQQTKRWRSEIDGRRWHDRLRMQWGYAYRRIDYTDIVSGAGLGGNRATLNDSLIGDTRDSITDPHRGRFWTAGAEMSLRALGSDVDYVRLYGQLFVYVPLGPRVVWAQGLRYGIVPGDDPLLLLERRFRAGGATTVRGFEENSLGPTYEDESIGGQAMLVFNQELRFPIWKTLHGGVFYDAGNVWALSSEFDLGSLRQAAGAGLRLMFPFGPVRLDWGYVLDPREGEERSRFHFSIGHAF